MQLTQSLTTLREVTLWVARPGRYLGNYHSLHEVAGLIIHLWAQEVLNQKLRT